MKHLITAIALLICLAGYSQLLTDTSYTAKNGMHFKIYKDVTLGYGSLPNGNYKHIYTSPLSFAGQHSLVAHFNGNLREIKGFKKWGKNEKTRMVYLLFEIGISTYWVEIENAIISEELFVPDQFKKKPEVIITGGLSKADEIAKLKKLLDDGILTQAEFDAEKKKVLDKN